MRLNKVQPNFQHTHSKVDKQCSLIMKRNFQLPKHTNCRSNAKHLRQTSTHSKNPRKKSRPTKENEADNRRLDVIQTIAQHNPI